jgi:hypothetical protein
MENAGTEKRPARKIIAILIIIWSSARQYRLVVGTAGDCIAPISPPGAGVRVRVALREPAVATLPR